LDLREARTPSGTVRNEEVNNLYFPLNVRSLTKSRRMRWAVRVARTGNNTNAFGLYIIKNLIK
jgi:hypothetical protein